MSATRNAARKVALLDAPAYLDVQRAQAALWLLEKIDGDHLSFYDHGAMSAADLEDWCRGICKDAIRASLAAAETAITDAVMAAPTGPVSPPRGVVPIRRAKGEPA